MTNRFDKALEAINQFHGKSGTYGLTQESYTDHLSGAFLANREIIVEALNLAASREAAEQRVIAVRGSSDVPGFEACVEAEMAASGKGETVNRLQTALGYFLNGEAYESTFPDGDADAKALRKSATWNRMTAQRLLTEQDQAACSAAMKSHASEQPEFKAAVRAAMDKIEGEKK